MAFGFSPKYSEEIPLADLTAEQFLVLAIESVTKIGWNIGYLTSKEFTAYTKISLVSWSEEVTVTINPASATVKSECTASQVMDWGKNKENVEKFIAAFTEIKNTLTTEEMAAKYEALKADFPAPESENAVDSPLATKGRAKGFFSLFVPVEGFYVTPILVNINIVVFIVMALMGVNIIQPDTRSLVTWGANFGPYTIDGGWWRLITSCFLHIGILHLMMNMYALLYIGILLEALLGRTRFILAYFLTGLLSSVTSVYWHELTVSAGASGAIFGLYGVFLALLLSNLIDKGARRALLPSISIFIGFNLLNGLKGNIDNAAHIGGLLSGIVAGFVFVPGLKREEDIGLNVQTITMLIIVAFAVSFGLIKQIPNNYAEYEKKYTTLVSMETMALEAEQLPEGTSKQKQIAELQNTGIYYWKECMQLLPEIEALELPKTLHELIDKHKKYCEVQLRCYQLQSMALSESTNKYDEEIKNCQEQAKACFNLTGQNGQ